MFFYFTWPNAVIVLTQRVDVVSVFVTATILRNILITQKQFKIIYI